MKKVLVVLLAVLLSAAAVYAEFYKVVVTRKGQDVYKVEDVYPRSIYIFTRHCHEHANREDAILKYERYGYDNKLIFDSGTECDVEAVR